MKIQIEKKIEEELEWFEYAKRENAHMRKFFVVRNRIKYLEKQLKELQEIK